MQNTSQKYKSHPLGQIFILNIAQLAFLQKLIEQ